MSLFDNIAILKKIQSSKVDPGIGLALKHWWFPASKKAYEETERKKEEFITTLLTALEDRVAANNYKNLSYEIAFLKNKEIISTFPLEIRKQLRFIYNNLQLIDERYKSYQQAIKDKTLRFNPSNRITTLNSSYCYSLGKTDGFCYGMVFAMVDEAISPFHQKEPHDPYSHYHLTQAIYDYQMNQKDRAKDQGTIKKNRMTLKHFCPDPAKQADIFLNYAKAHPGKNLYISLKNQDWGHAIYLKYENGTIAYAEPRAGAYLFNKVKEGENEDAFKNLYKLFYGPLEERGIFYSISELRHAPNQPEIKTWRGKFRSLLTGNKYGNSITLNLLNYGVYMLGGALLFGALGGAAALMMGSIPFSAPVFLLAGGIIVGAMGGAYLGYVGVEAALFHHQRGLLALPYFLLEQAYYIKHHFISFFTFKKAFEPAGVRPAPRLEELNKQKEEGVSPVPLFTPAPSTVDNQNSDNNAAQSNCAP